MAVMLLLSCSFFPPQTHLFSLFFPLWDNLVGLLCFQRSDVVVRVGFLHSFPIFHILLCTLFFKVIQFSKFSLSGIVQTGILSPHPHSPFSEVTVLDSLCCLGFTCGFSSNIFELMLTEFPV